MSASAYALCVVTGVGVLLNLILLVWHVMRFKGGSVFVKYSLAQLYIWHLIIGLSLALLVLQRDLPSSPWLCSGAGFLALFASQEAVWTLAASSASVLHWKLRRPTSTQRKKHAALALLSALLQAVFLAILSTLPLLNTPGGDNLSCVPLRLQGERGWAATVAALSLDWVAILLAVVVVIIMRRLPSHKPSAKYELRHSISIPVGLLAWTVVICMGTYLFFTGARSSWTLAFAVSGVTAVHPAISLILIHVTNRKQKKNACANCGYAGMQRRLSQHSSTFSVNGKLYSSCPKNLASISKIDHPQGQVIDNWLFENKLEHGVSSQFLVQWREKVGSLRSGVMKVFPPASLQRWRSEVNCLLRLSSAPHPNLSPCHWVAPHNNYTAAICAFTHQVLSPESSVVCRDHFAHGSLHEFLLARELTEVTLHKVTRDITSGLDHLHSLNIVHNALTSHSVHMTSPAENGGVRAVISDFDCSYELSIFPSSCSLAHPRSLWSISSEVASHPSKFASDIRALGVIVLEMLLVTGKRRASSRVSASQRSFDQDSMSAECKCSSSVKDIRACTDSPDTDNKLFSNFLELLSDHPTRQPSAFEARGKRRTSANRLGHKAHSKSVDCIQQRSLPPVPCVAQTQLTRMTQLSGLNSEEMLDVAIPLYDDFSSHETPDHVYTDVAGQQHSSHDSSEDSSPMTPDDVYNTSAVSFETIYEDEEVSQRNASRKNRFQRTLPVRRRMERSKRASIASLEGNISITSDADSGFHQSELNGSERADGSDVSMLSQQVRGDSGVESNGECVDESRLPHLYLMKQPCRKRHHMRPSASEPFSLASRDRTDYKTHSLPKLGVSAVHTARKISARASPSDESPTSPDDPLSSSRLRGSPQDDGRESVSSSIADLVHDSELIIKQVMEKEDVLADLEAFRKRPSSGASRRMMRTLREMGERGALGFIAQQMLPVMRECWQNDHTPSSEYILRRLNHVLPSAAV
ncbi:hypothetical protein CAPTEDRAFT_220699 [Capitella teleta]|uniref:Protein kinase domain-containing protein n=1 Tax=Capitella teleta TaxID=283909 RepID=R7UQ26_CAPTE|nr:hypothetical protein CAPTEDRAFT_220699 [Capitella teleta]|eukprot:ELU08604.1 hypothetical protein CAPTEDRAFT_220699 [Capitella teleta]